MTSIQEALNRKQALLSFEIFPPRREADIAGLPELLRRLSALTPDFVSVTCGAGGVSPTENRTVAIAGEWQSRHGIPALAHLTCVAATKEGIRQTLDDMHSQGVGHVLALRGDLPQGMDSPAQFRYAYELMEVLRADGRFTIGGACYPEGHISSDRMEDDISHLRQKQEAGADFFISQLFFDNTSFYRFIDQARLGGVTRPILAGVMPILGRSQIERMIFLCGASLPSRVIKILHRYEHQPADLRKAGIEYALEQLLDLRQNGAEGLHIYAMNKADVAESLASALS